jgi:hypothetical protein
MVWIMRTLRVDALNHCTTRILTAFTLSLVMLTSSQIAFGKIAKGGRHSLALSPMKKASLLNYPPIPKDLAARIASGKTDRTVVAAASYDASLAHHWPLANIGFFQAFTPLLQPAKPTTQSCSPKVVVAVVDTGIDYTHPELKDHLWINSGEAGPWEPPAELASLTTCRDKSCNGIDDDGNGFVDDVAGWDFVNEQPLPFDVHGHGTHIAGIISSSPAMNVGMVGVCPSATIMPLKYYDNSGLGYNNLQNTVRAMRYAIRMGANIINYSGGGADPAASERAAIEEAQKKGILVIAAAGNDGHNNDQVPYYPASYGLDNIVSVASINREYELLPSSNYGTKSVNIAAPGLSILSALPTGKFGTMSGTSQATAFVTGAAAMLASQYKDMNEFDFRRIKHWLVEGAKPLPGNDKHRILGGGVLAVARSLEIQRDDLNKKSVPMAVHSDLALKPRKTSTSNVQ